MKLKALEILQALANDKKAPEFKEKYEIKTESDLRNFVKEAIEELEAMNSNKTLSLIADEHDELVNEIQKLRKELREQKQNPVLGEGKFKVLACRGENQLRGKFYALAILPTSDGLRREVGEILPKSELIQNIDDNIDTAIYFTNTESVDVVIDTLNKVKKYIEVSVKPELDDINQSAIYKLAGYESDGRE